MRSSPYADSVSYIAYLGPPGTFTEQATRVLTDGFDVELVPCESVPAALDALRAGEVLAAGVPVENSVEGSVSVTLDALIDGDPVTAVAETVLPIQFDVLVRPGTSADQVATVASHPHAIAQVREWLRTNLPGAAEHATSSTASAADAVRDGHYDAAVVAPAAAEHHPELETLVNGIADVRDALTRFLLLRRPGMLPEPTGADRTSIVATMTDEVGALTNLLTELSHRGINLTRIESRPTKDRLGEYWFFLDFDGHVADARVGEALAALWRRCGEVRFLGSYEKADRSPASVRPSASEQAFHAATEWLNEVRAGRSA